MEKWIPGEFNDDSYEMYIRDFYANFTHLKIQKSSIPGAGLGVFANGAMQRGEIVTDFPGRLVNMYKNVLYPLEFKLNKYNADSDKFDSLYLDPYVPGTDLSIGCGHLINSVHPALKFKKKNCDFYANDKHPWISVIALKDIPDGTEFLADYHHMLTHRLDKKCKCKVCKSEKYDCLFQFQRERKGAPAAVKETATGTVSREHLIRSCQNTKRKFDLAFI